MLNLLSICAGAEEIARIRAPESFFSSGPEQDGLQTGFSGDMIPSINKSKHACQRVFPVPFTLFALACAGKPVFHPPPKKITGKFIAGQVQMRLSLMV